MPRLSSPTKAWLSAEVPAELAEEFRSAAAQADRTPTQHLRHLVREHLVEVNKGTPAAPTPPRSQKADGAGPRVAT